MTKNKKIKERRELIGVVIALVSLMILSCVCGYITAFYENTVTMYLMFIFISVFDCLVAYLLIKIFKFFEKELLKFFERK